MTTINAQSKIQISDIPVKRKNFNIYKFLNYFFLILITGLTAVPLLWSWKAAFLPSSEIFELNLFSFNGSWTFQNFREGFASAPFMTFLFNSALISIVSTVIILISSLSAGYAFSQFRFKGKNLLFTLIIIALVMPFQAIMIPLFLGTAKAGLINTHMGIILPSAVSAFGIFMMRQFLLNTPRDLIDAALIDGCSQLGVFWRIIVPLTRGPLATLAAISFLGVWNNYLWPLMVAQEVNMYTLPVGLSLLQGTYATNYGTIFAGSLLACVPALLVFLIMRRQIINNYAMSGLTQ
jgi:ABC-type glycerol-3-phosphate transport system permease component